MEIFQDGAFPNLEYHLFQMIDVIQHLLGKVTVKMILIVETDIFM